MRSCAWRRADILQDPRQGDGRGRTALFVLLLRKKSIIVRWAGGRPLVKQTSLSDHQILQTFVSATKTTVRSTENPGDGRRSACSPSTDTNVGCELCAHNLVGLHECVLTRNPQLPYDGYKSWINHLCRQALLKQPHTSCPRFGPRGHRRARFSALSSSCS